MNIKNFHSYSCWASITDESVNVIASHQLLEHVRNVEDRLGLYYRKLSSKGILVLSTGFHLHPHPGHLPSSVEYCGREREIVEDIGFKPFDFTGIVYALTGNLIYGKE